ncbi:MAG: polysaccharide deacetylase family protein [Sandaracinaceae bacterium]|nr:polysaccharide deacetylase family protein [Sandaracinaceae bacterium]
MPGPLSVRRLASILGGALALASGAVTAELTQAATRPAENALVTEGLVPEGLVPDADPSPENSAPTPEPREASVALEVPPAPPREESGSQSDAPPSWPTSADAVSSNLRDGRIITGATAHRFILFTFDDGPDVRYTRDLLDALDEADVHALFFLTTRRFEDRTPYAQGLAAIAREIVARGHRVGSHSMDHVQLPLVSTPDLATQVDASASIIEREIGVLPALIRPPGGSRSPRIDLYLASHGYTQVLWNLGTGDVQVRSADAVLDTFRRVLEVRERQHGERGGIVLLHDIHGWSVEAFPRIVAYLDRKNCELLEAGEELYDFVDDPAFFYEARREGDAADAIADATIPDEVIASRQIHARARAALRCEDTAALDAIIAGG